MLSQVHLVEGETTEKLVGVIMNMMDGVVVGDGTGVFCSVVAACMTTVVFIGHDVYRAGDQEPSEWRAMVSHSIASNLAMAMVSRSSASRRGRLVIGGPGVVRM
jgi:hypothetical protein